MGDTLGNASEARVTNETHGESETHGLDDAHVVDETHGLEEALAPEEGSVTDGTRAPNETCAVDFSALSDDAIMRELGRLSSLVRRSMRSMEKAGHAEELLIHLALHEDALREGFAAKPLSQVEIAEFLGIRPQSAGAIIRQLEDRGLIKRAIDQQDKRAYQVLLTEAGRAEAKEVRDLQRRYAGQALSVLNKDEKAAFASMVVKLADTMESLSE